MDYFHGRYKRRRYFEGWYYKMTASTNAEAEDGSVLAFIPGIQMDEEGGGRTAFIQVITGDGAFFVPYDFGEFKVDRREIGIRIGENFFGRPGIKVDIQTEGFTLKGKARFGPFTPVRYPIMGPFRFLPFLECSHGIISMCHTVSGGFLLNGRTFSFQNAPGYIEMDWGSSFPEKYLWLQANSVRDHCSIMASVASVPVFGTVIRGCICVVNLYGREYRLATYLGVKVLRYEENRLVLKQGTQILDVCCLETKKGGVHGLKAPRRGSMARTIHENASARVRCRFQDGGSGVEFETGNAGWEWTP